MKATQTKSIGTSALNLEYWRFDVLLHRPSILHPPPSILALLLLLLASASSALATVRYVDGNSANPAPPYTNWTTAAHVIQDAVDAALAGDEIVVTNGTYAAGGRALGTNLLVNRVVVNMPLTLRSVNGPEFTVIHGHQVPGTTNGDGAIRCVYLADGANLSGFTLTNGATRTDGDLWRDLSGGGAWCESVNAVVSNCILLGNSAYALGGGAYGGTLNHCKLTGNSATGQDILCGAGGGACGATLNNCTLTGNNAAWNSGGGSLWGTLKNCALIGNYSAFRGGGASGATLINCTLTGNSARDQGGGADNATLSNCILHYNTALVGVNYSSDCTLNYCCTMPLPMSGTGNLSLDPQLASTTHLSATSPCRGAGNAGFASGTDMDGEVWANPPSIGCDEYRDGALTGSLSVGLTVAYTNVVVGFPVEFTALIEGRTTASRWDFGDAVTVSNRPYASHVWAAPGEYAAVLRAYNESYPAGVSATVTIHVLAQPVYHVAADSSNPMPPYTSWATAATNIQDAVDAADAGSLPPGSVLVVVSNGVYATGGRAVGTYVLVNRVAVDKPLTLRSVNGPEFTIIQGHQVPVTTNGDGAIRCVYLTNGASLSGFTLTNGATRGEAAAYDDDRELSGGGLWCDSAAALVSNCVLAANSAFSGGGGALGGTLNNCALIGNSAGRLGGGAFEGVYNSCTLNNCTLTGNSAGSAGGGTRWCTLNNCILSGNSAASGGGTFVGTLNNCILTGNSATESGGGVLDGWLNNCTLTGNSAGDRGGGVAVSRAEMGGCFLNNCIVCFNDAPNGANYDDWGTLNYCCTTPMPTNGVGNISLDPQLASASHLSASSPCRGAGGAAYTTGSDIDGEAWATPPSIGCDEYHAGAVTSPLNVGIGAAYTNVALGFPVDFRALIEGQTTASVWVFGDGAIAINRPYATHAWTATGDYTLTLWAFNESHPEGVSASVTILVVAQPVQYVDVRSPNPLPPYTSWATAATNIQDAVDAAAPGSLVLVTNGTYATGGRPGNRVPGNRVTVDRSVALRSVNGPLLTVINGGSAVRCVYLADGTSLSGFTLTNGAADGGGGVWCESTSTVVSNCVVVGNSALGGGGAWGGTLNNCTLAGNSANFWGGGAFGGTLNNCTLTLNSANGDYSYGGGAYGGTVNNCIVYFNTAVIGANYYQYQYDGILNYCCTTPMPTNGVGNITNAPLFVNYAGGNLRLQSNSPCINAGNNAYAPGPTDLDGNPRIVSGTVDIGAYEFQGSGSVISYAWLQQYGLPTDGSADFTDSDRDGLNNWQEWRCLTDPTNALSALRLLSASPAGTNVTVTWQSVAGVNYFLERSTNLGPSTLFTPLATGISGQPGTTTYMDTNAVGTEPFFYRVGAGN